MNFRLAGWLTMAVATILPNLSLAATSGDANPVADPRGYVAIDLSKGGVQCDLSDLKRREKIVIGGQPIDSAKPPAGLVHRPELGVILPEWINVRPMHRWPLPPFENFEPPPGVAGPIKLRHANSYADCPRPFFTSAGDLLLTLIAGDYHYGYCPIEMKVNDIFLYRSRDHGKTWEPPVKAPNRFNQHAWVPLVPQHSFGGKRIVVFFTFPTPGDYNGHENAGIGFRFSDDDGRTWSEPQRIRPVNDPDFQGMFCINATETARGTWLIAPHCGDWTKKSRRAPLETQLYLLRSEDQGKTWTLLPDKRPGGWQYKPAHRMDEGRPIWLHGDKVALFARTQEGHIWRAISNDDGKTWGEFQPTALVQPDAPPMIQKLSDGKRLIALHHNRHSGGAFNMEDRSELWVSISDDDGDTWSEPRFLMVTSTTTSRLLFGRTHFNLTYSDALAMPNGDLHIFVPHLWRQVLQLTLRETDLQKLPTRADIAKALGAKPQATAACQWQPMELTFTAGKDCDDPFDFVRAKLSATFAGPDGARLEVPGFWDGGRTWKIRFTPTRAGEWSYATSFTDAGDHGLHGQRGIFQAGLPAPGNALRLHGGFLKTSDNGHYLTYADGTPFFWLGDTWWAVPSANTPFENFKRMVDTRVAQGFTVFQAHGHRALFPDAKGRGIGALEATRAPDEETLRYWHETDRFIACADERGLVGVIGFAGHSLLDAPSLDDLKRLWHYYLARYGAYAVTFLITQEYNARLGNVAERVPKLLALGRFIKETDPYHRAMTVHPWTHSSDHREAWTEPWLDFILFQAGHGRFAPAEFYWGAYGRDAHKPLIEGEANYEGFVRKTFEANAAAVRRSACTAIQSGCCGFTYGAQGLYAGVLDHNRPLTTAQWGPVLTWEEGLALPGGAQLQHLRACYESVAWWKLEPALAAVEPPGDVLVKADGVNTLLLYFPAGAKVSPSASLVRMPEGGSYLAEWFDLRTGKGAKLEVALTVKNDRLPLPHRPDEQDWMLVLKRKPMK